MYSWVYILLYTFICVCVYIIYICRCVCVHVYLHSCLYMMIIIEVKGYDSYGWEGDGGTLYNWFSVLWLSIKIFSCIRLMIPLQIDEPSKWIISLFLSWNLNSQRCRSPKILIRALSISLTAIIIMLYSVIRLILLNNKLLNSKWKSRNYL